MRLGSVAVALVCVVGVGAVLAVPAVAESGAALQQAVVDARGPSGCGPLTYNPVVEHAADIVNRSTYTYLAHTAENVPADDPHPTAIVHDLGINTDRALTLQGAGLDSSAALRGLLLQGRDAIPDCSYTDFGVSQLYEPESGYVLSVVVLVGT